MDLKLLRLTFICICWSVLYHGLKGQCGRGPGWTGPSCDRYDYAFNKSAEQKDSYLTGTQQLAIDGDPSTCSNTTIIDTPWWTVNIGYEVNVDGLTMHIGAETLNILKAFTVEVHDPRTGEWSMCYNHSSDVANLTNPVEIGCKQVLRGNSVRFTVHNQAANLVLCTVGVYGTCVDGTYGSYCTESCGRCNLTNTACDKATGRCPLGCDKVGVNLLPNYMIRYLFDEKKGLPATYFIYIRVGFTTKKKQGFLVQIREETNYYRKYISLEMNNNGGVKFFVDVGFERWELNTPINNVDLTDGKAHEVILRRTNRGKDVTLQVDNYEPAISRLGQCISYNILDPDHPKYLFIGNNDIFNTAKGFEGCIFHVQIDNIFPLKRAFQDPRASYITYNPPACPAGTFSDQCSGRCGFCPDDRNCIRFNSLCSESECEPGYILPNCTLACDDKHWGNNCGNDCPNCYEKASTLPGPCNKTDGTCALGCAAGYYNDGVCLRECPIGKWGINCEKRCRISCYVEHPPDSNNWKWSACLKHNGGCQHRCTHMDMVEVGVSLQTNYMLRYMFDEKKGLLGADCDNCIFIRVGFSTRKKQGILIQIRDETNKEYISLEINNNGGVTFFVDVGFERLELDTAINNVDLTDGQAHYVYLRRTNRGRNITLHLDKYMYKPMTASLGESISDSILDPKYLFIGNNDTVNTANGFEGCIFHVQIDNIFPLKRAFQDPRASYIIYNPPACPAGTFGDQCTGNCGIFMDDRNCIRFNSWCPNKACDLECPVGKWGIKCEKTCGHVCSIEDPPNSNNWKPTGCLKHNGGCEHGCLDGSSGTMVEVGVNLQTNYMLRYLFDDKNGLPVMCTDFMYIRVGFTTKKKQGILVQLKDETNKEYVSLEMNNNGGVKFFLDVGFERWELNTPINNVDYTDGQAHEVILRRTNRGRDVILQVDNYEPAISRLGETISDSILDNPKYLFIGNNDTANTAKGFEGCIFHVQIDKFFPLKRAFQDPRPSYITYRPQACPGGTFGDKCSGRCGISMEDRNCIRFNSWCPDSACELDCDDGTYGWDCTSKCGACAIACNKTNGYCEGDCLPGYMPPVDKVNPNCTLPCDDKHWGHNCGNDCPNCYEKVSTLPGPCNKTDGTCALGCAAGYNNDSACLTECPDGKWGMNCEETCGNCAIEDPPNSKNSQPTACLKHNGSCQHGCLDGYKGDTCLDACRVNHYGPNCETPCGNCREGSTCNQTNGYCAQGCKTDWTGLKCDSKTHEPNHGPVIGGAISGTIAGGLIIAFVVWVVWRYTPEEINPSSGCHFGTVRRMLRIISMTTQNTLKRRHMTKTNTISQVSFNNVIGTLYNRF